MLEIILGKERELIFVSQLLKFFIFKPLFKEVLALVYVVLLYAAKH